MNLYRSLILLCLLIIQPALALTLHSRHDSEIAPPRWSKAEQGWLRQAKLLRVGLLEQDYRPFSMIVSQSRFEGISADYLGILAKILHKPLALRPFADKESALLALRR